MKHFKLDFYAWTAIDAKPGKGFECAPLNGDSYLCRSINFQLQPNGIYFIDVEIEDNHMSAYVTEPQPDLTKLSRNDVPRKLIGDQNSCKNAYEVITVNCTPQQYKDPKGVKESCPLTEAQIFDSKCGEENILAATTADKKCTIYFTRPTV